MANDGVVVFAAFDLVWLNGKDLRDQPLVERKELLRFRIRHPADRLAVRRLCRGKGKALYSRICERDMEGIVCKPMISPYRMVAARRPGSRSRIRSTRRPKVAESCSTNDAAESGRNRNWPHPVSMTVHVRNRTDGNRIEREYRTVLWQREDSSLTRFQVPNHPKFSLGRVQSRPFLFPRQHRKKIPQYVRGLMPGPTCCCIRAPHPV